ncbi:hypothetical protein FRX31_010596 [Thalictrum thalictroides]|uniref:Uncharacterized protein n=1 Tax=Thalictrum thalictroides TaxID=46969 RepID=A0A7J6WTL5_THATH|nr:hypothetical protein FRX31_010596 [Thalictrum thalictroides]
MEKEQAAQALSSTSLGSVWVRASPNGWVKLEVRFELAEIKRPNGTLKLEKCLVNWSEYILT